MNTMKYKDYIARIDYDPDIKLFCGTVINATPNTFYGPSVEELEREFACTMEEYFKFCREKGIEPKRPYSEKFNLRITPELQKERLVL
ncbi:type II toxin-antitoxin system HicB family antitoxin [bacterium]|nr:type II toxin-antitoxin system HicB family antitoxin [bacterium]MBU1613879.1 type II toxin-antitoxin system HicB family antitoxin [bacterium]